MAGECEIDQPVEQLRVRDPRGFPELRVHRDRREARDRVDFVDEEPAPSGPVLEEEVDALNQDLPDGWNMTTGEVSDEDEDEDEDD